MSQSVQSLSDEELLIAIVLKDEDEATALAAFEQFHGRFAARVWICTKAALPGLPAQDVEDAVQTALLAVWQKADQFDPRRGTPWSWLRTIAKNAAIDQLRRAYPTVELQENLKHADAVTLPRDVEEDLTRGEKSAQLKQLHQCLDELSDKERELIKERYTQPHMTTEAKVELAQKYNTIWDSLRVTRNRALDKLKRCMGALELPKGGDHHD